MLLAGGLHLNSKLLHNTKGFSLPPSSYYHSHDNDDKSFKNTQQVNMQIMWNGWIRRMKWQQLCSLKNIHHAALIKSGSSPRQPLYSPGKKHKQNLISLGLKESTQQQDSFEQKYTREIFWHITANLHSAKTDVRGIWTLPI